LSPARLMGNLLSSRGRCPSHMGFREEQHMELPFANWRTQGEACFATENPCATGMN